jgi:hypothetical protein
MVKWQVDNDVALTAKPKDDVALGLTLLHDDATWLKTKGEKLCGAWSA